MTEPTRRFPPALRIGLKLLIAAAVVAWMLHKDLIRLDDLRRAAGHWPLLIAAFALLFLNVFLSGVRWSLLLRAQGIHLPLRHLFRLNMTGFFFTTVAPGGLGGDAVKAYYLARSAHKKTEAVTTIFLDRLLGFATLFLAAGLVALLVFRQLWDARTPGAELLGIPFGRLFILLLIASSAALLAFTLLAASRRVRRSPLTARLGRRLPFPATLARIYDAIHLYRRHPRFLLAAALMSVACQTPLYAIYYLCSLAVGADLSAWQCILLVPAILVIRVLPIVPGGAGQGVVAAALLFPLVGVPAGKGAAVGTVADALFLLLYLSGGLVFLLGAGHRPQPDPAPTEHAP